MVAATNAKENRAKDNRNGWKSQAEYQAIGNMKTKDNYNMKTNCKAKDYGNSRSSYMKSSMSFRKDNDRNEDDEELRGGKVRRPAEKSRSSQKNELDQWEKLEILKRLEREKKAVQKKSREEETEKFKRPAAKQKRSIRDWTKDYEYGLLDDGEDYRMD